MWKGYLVYRQTAKAQASLHIRAVLPEPSLLADITLIELEDASDMHMHV